MLSFVLPLSCAWFISRYKSIALITWITSFLSFNHSNLSHFPHKIWKTITIVFVWLIFLGNYTRISLSGLKHRTLILFWFLRKNVKDQDARNAGVSSLSGVQKVLSLHVWIFLPPSLGMFSQALPWMSPKSYRNHSTHC